MVKLMKKAILSEGFMPDGILLKKGGGSQPSVLMIKKEGKMRAGGIWIIILVSVIISGCATVHRGHGLQNQELQNRISYLEAELERKNQELRGLESELAMSQSAPVAAKEGKAVSRLSAKQIQAALKNAGFYKGDIDGSLGPKTKEAIRNFQKANGLYPDGVAGKQTREKLKRYLE